MEASRQHGRFNSHYTDEELYTVVAEVVRFVDPDEPERVSQRRFDGVRAAAGYPDAPSARAICMRLGVGWPELLAVALDENRSVTQTEAARTSAPDDPHLGEAHVAYALRRAAIELGQHTVSKEDYRSCRRRWLRAEQRRFGRGGILDTVVPTESQIIRIAGSWDAALLLAGLDSSSAPSDDQSGAVSVANAIDLYIEVSVLAATPAIPGQPELERFARDSGFKLARRPPGKRYSEVLAEVLQRRAEAGLPTPGGQLPVSERTLVAPAELVKERGLPVRTKLAGRRDCVEALIAFHTSLPSKERRTHRRYFDWVQEERREGRQWPWPSRFDAFGGYSALLAEAQKRARWAA